MLPLTAGTQPGGEQPDPS